MAYLIIEYSGNRKVSPIEKEIVSIGKINECDIIVEDETIANIHCHISRADDGSYRLLSLGNLSLLNGKEARKEKLKPGDNITIGRTRITFEEGIPSAVDTEIYPESESEVICLKPEIPEEQTPFAVCELCGKRFKGEGKVCPECSGKSAEKGVPEQREGLWSLLGEGAQSQSGLSFEEVQRMVKLGEITRYSTVKGPTTNYEWKYASETPRLCRYLSICYQCGGRVETQQTFCHICGIDLDGLGRKRAGTEEKVIIERKRSFKKGAFILLIIAALLCLVGVFFTSGLWRYIFPAALENRIDSFKAGTELQIKRFIGPEIFEEERERMQKAKEFAQRAKYNEARAIYNDIVNKYPASALAEEAREELRSIKETIEIKSMKNLGDNFFSRGMYNKALAKYEEIKKKYPDNPLTKDIDEKIEKTKSLMKD